MGVHEVEASQDPRSETRSENNPKGKRDRQVVDTRNAVDWNVVGQEYIYGIVSEDKKKGEFKRHYPSFRELARRHGLPHPTVGYYARKFNWGDRRERFKDHLRNEFDKEVAKARALSAGDVLATIDTYLRLFHKAVEADGVARASMKDLDVAVRLKAFVQKEVDRSNDSTATLNLAQLQARHSKQREIVRQLTGAEVGFIDGKTEREGATLGPSGDDAPDSGMPGAEEPAGPRAKEEASSAEEELRSGPSSEEEPVKSKGGRPRNPRGWNSASRSSVLWSRALRACLAHLSAAEQAELNGVLDARGKHGGPRARKNRAASDAVMAGANVCE